MIIDANRICDSEKITLFFPGIRFLVDVSKNYYNCCKYKNNCLQNISSNNKKEIYVLSLLKELGFSLELVGTYFYKDMIMKISYYMEDISPKREINNFESLISQLKNHYSQFYFDIARNDLDVGIKTFHRFIREAISNRNFSEIDLNLYKQIFYDYSNNLEYEYLALIIGTFVSGMLYDLEVQNIETTTKKLVLK